ncbi:MAG TPA: trypsin-like peptidase domain-containing protein [Solirubrobacteraceae bacterium]|nr:trypsin-like peptidase domain-containing protein [Solirubrobacteraceae bacterium]
MTPLTLTTRGHRSAAVLAVTAVLGGVAGGGIVAASGGDSGTAATTTTVMRTVANTSSSSTDALDANAIYDSTSAGVVDITATGTGSTQPDPFGQGGGQSSEATGSGFVVDSDGYIVTAAHVVDGANSLKVTFSDGTTRTAKLVGKDDATDVAVIKVDPSGLTLHPLELGSSSALDVGDAVAVIGSPFGYAESLSTGIVSGLDRTIEAPNGFTVSHAVQIDAAVNPGNSGGPVLNADGQVIGIADQIATDGSSEQSSGVGFAVPIDLIANELDQLKAGESVSHAYLGLRTGDSTDPAGALVGSVTAGTPASQAGLRSGDVVTAIDGKQITGSGDLVAAISAHKPGDKIELTVRRGSSTEHLTATLATQPSSANNAPPTTP